MRAAQPQRQAPQQMQVSTRMLIVQPLRARHRLARDGNRARGAKRPEEVQGRERGDRASRRYRRGLRRRQQRTDGVSQACFFFIEGTSLCVREGRGGTKNKRWATYTHAREEFDKRVRERLHDAVGFREERAVWFLGKLGWITIPAW